MLRASIVFAGVYESVSLWFCLWVYKSVCLSVCRKSRKLLVGNWCNMVGICSLVNARSAWKLITFDLDLWPWEFVFFEIQAIPFECLDLATSFSVWRYIFKISRSRFSFKVMVPRSRSRERISGGMQLKNYLSEIVRAWSEYMLR